MVSNTLFMGEWVHFIVIISSDVRHHIPILIYYVMPYTEKILRIFCVIFPAQVQTSETIVCVNRAYTN